MAVISTIEGQLLLQIEVKTKKTTLLFMIIFIDDYSSLVLFIEQKIENKLKLADHHYKCSDI